MMTINSLVNVEELKKTKNEIRSEITRIEAELEKLKEEVKLLRSAEDNIDTILSAFGSLEFDIAELEFKES